MPRYIEPEVLQKAVDLYRSGTSLAASSAQVGIHVSTLRHYLQRENIQIDGTRTRRSANEQVRDEIVRLYAEGVPNKEIARRLGIEADRHGNYNVIYSTLRARGVRRRTPMDSNVGKTMPVGTVKVKADGYVIEKVAPDWEYLDRMRGYGDGSWLLQHRKVMAETLGRPLLTSEQVHHRDGDRSNNAPENLQLRIGGHGSGVSYCCADCGSRALEPVDLGPVV